MPKQPLYPHVPKRKEPLFPYRHAGDVTINWDLKKTDLPYYDNMLKDPEYYKRAKGVVGKIEWMSPKSYLAKVAKLLGTTPSRTLIWVDPILAERYAGQMEAGDVFPIPVINYDLSEQEGRHRAWAAHYLKAKEIPVLVVRPVSEIRSVPMAAFDRDTVIALQLSWQGLSKEDELEHLRAKWRAAGTKADLIRFVEVAQATPEYQSNIRAALRRQYGPEINVYRGGKWFGDYVSVTTDIDTAKGFARDRGEKHLLFKIRTDDVIAVGDMADCELIVKASALEPRGKAPTIDLDEKLTPRTPESRRPPYGSPDSLLQIGDQVPRYMYHVPRGKAAFGKPVYAYPIREIEAADRFGPGYKEGTYVWLSRKPMLGTDNVYVIDLMRLNNDDLRDTGQVEGHFLHRGDIPAEAVVAIMRRGMLTEKRQYA